jgi:hypothetical protein
MIEPLNDPPGGVIAFEAVGEVHADDYRDVLVPAIDAAVETGEVRLVFVLGDRFDGYSAGAAWQDTKLGMHHVKAWKRTAIVTDVDWLTHVASLFGWMIPGEFAHYPLARLDEALAWAASDES